MPVGGEIGTLLRTVIGVGVFGVLDKKVLIFPVSTKETFTSKLLVVNEINVLTSF